ncbi:MAG: transporter substrate-binding domain-containing protein [Coriobacteriia bacterium]|nr:transporter substrate-binding domain-containing protein [Coriobacteriia bacterium]
MSVSKKRVSLAVSVILCLGLFLGACGNNGNGANNNGGEEETTNELGLIEEGKLFIGSDCDYPPFIWIEDGTVATGFERELMEAIADDLELELVYLNPQNFDSLFASIATGGIMDLAVSSITITDVRKELVDFCNPYFVVDQAIVTLETSSYTSYADLEGKIVGAQSGTTGLDWATESIDGAIIKEFNQTSEGMAALLAGEIDALVYDSPVASWHVNNNYPECHVIQIIPTGEQYGFAVSKDNPALQAAVNDSLGRLIENGTYASLHAKYFDFDITIN